MIANNMNLSQQGVSFLLRIINNFLFRACVFCNIKRKLQLTGQLIWHKLEIIDGSNFFKR